MGRLPDFLVIGAKKCGTSWLHVMLSRHPDVAVPDRKELHFFNEDEHYERGPEWYAAQFPDGPAGSACGESTPNYFDVIGIPERVAGVVPDVRLVVALRDPVERAVSAFHHGLRHRRWPGWPSFESVASETIIGQGMYAGHLERWLEFFPRESILVLVLEEDIGGKDNTALARVYDHIGVSPDFVPPGTDEIIHRDLTGYELRLERMPRAVRGALRRAPASVREARAWVPEVDDDERRRLREMYEPDIRQLESMLGRSLPWGEAEQRPPD